MTARPQLGDPTIWHYPQPEIVTLPNGLGLWAFDLPGQHVIALDLVIDAPLSLEPKGLEGVGLLAARVAGEGTVPHPGSSITEQLELNGAVQTASVGHLATTCSLDVPATRLDAALPLLAEIVLQPAFEPGDVAREVALQHSEIDHALASAPATASLARRQLIHPAGSRFHTPAGGTHTSLERIDADSVRAFAETAWRPDRAVLVVAGDLPDDLLNLAATTFGAWIPAATPPPELDAAWSAPTTTASRRVVHLVDRPDAVQAEVRIFGLAPDRSDPGLPGLQVATSALGGTFLSRLNSLLREELGYTYGAHLGVAPQRSGGTWSASWSCRTPVTADALDRALGVLALKAPLTVEETRDAVNHIIGVAPLRYETAGGIAQQARGLVAAHQPASYPNTHFARVAATTADTATNLARQHVRPDNCWIVVVGAADALAPDLTARGFEVEPLVVAGP